MKFLHKKHQIKKKGIKKMNSNEDILNLVLIGAKNSGKTYFLSQLSNRNRLLSANDSTTRYLKKIKENIKQYGQTQATSATWHELEFTYQKKIYGKINFNIDDYDGNLTETMSGDNNTNEKNKLKENVQVSEGCIFFIPFEKETERLKNFADEIDAFINMAQFNNKEKSPIPACIVITKWDESEAFGTPNELNIGKQYILDDENLKIIYEKIESFFEHTKIMVISSKKDYNLLNPIDFCLGKTFCQWYEKAKELEKNEKWEELYGYLSNRWKNIEQNKVYVFKSIYDNAEKIFTPIKNKRDLEAKKLKQKQRYKNITIILIVVFLSIFYYVYKINFDAEEKYNKIKLLYSSGKTYEDLKMQIEEFDNINPIKEINIFVFFDYKSAKKDIDKIESDLINLDMEKRKKEKELAEQKEAKQKQDRENIFLEELKNCLEESCKNTKYGMEKISKLIDKIDSDFRENQKINSIKINLESKLSNFKLENWKKDAKECLADDNCTRKDLLDYTKKYGDIDEDVKEINLSLRLKLKYLDLKNKIEKSEISKIEESEFDNFTEQYKNEIKFILEKRLRKYFDDEIIAGIPTAVTDEDAVKDWETKYNKFKKDSENNFGFKFEFKSNEIDNFDKERKKVEKLKKDGINHIKVTIIGKEGNTINFGCGYKWGRDQSNIIIKGFNNSKLSYENSSVCKDDKFSAIVEFKDKITLNVKDYHLVLIEDNIISIEKVAKNYKIEEKVSFSVEDLYKLQNNGTIIKHIDNNKIELKFEYVGSKNAN